MKNFKKYSLAILASLLMLSGNVFGMHHNKRLDSPMTYLDQVRQRSIQSSPLRSPSCSPDMVVNFSPIGSPLGLSNNTRLLGEVCEKMSQELIDLMESPLGNSVFTEFFKDINLDSIVDGSEKSKFLNFVIKYKPQEVLFDSGFKQILKTVLYDKFHRLGLDKIEHSFSERLFFGFINCRFSQTVKYGSKLEGPIKQLIDGFKLDAFDYGSTIENEEAVEDKPVFLKKFVFKIYKLLELLFKDNRLFEVAEKKIG